ASQRLIREAQVMARLSHPNVVAVHDAGFAEQRVFLAMELVRGQTLRAWLEATQPTWRAILAVFLDAGRGLAAAHADGIIHRDFKPENVLVSDEADGRRVRVADFGLANYDLQSAAAPPRGAALALTATGAVVGTPVYMAPEQHAGLPLDAAADQFSFCVALHEALFAQRPFAGDSAIEIATNVCEGRYVAPIHSRRAPRWLSNAIRRGLAADPRARYCDFAELLAALARDPIARVRRGVAIAAAGIALALGSWALAARAEPCEGARAEIAAVWNDDARARVQQALVDAPQSAEKTVAALDRYADDWAVQHREMCTAHQAGSISAPLLDGAMHCLDQREAALARLVGAIGVGSASDATLAAIALPAIASCGDRNALARAVALPSDETSAHAVAELRRRLVEVEVVHHAGAIAAAQEELAMIADLARPLAYAPLSAEVELVAGRLAMERFEWALATERFAAAAELGVGAGADAVAAEALARELFLDALAAHAPEQVLPRARVVTGLVHRLGDPPALASLLANNLGVAQAQAGRTADAERSFAEAVALAEQTPAVNASDLAGYRINLARHTADAERRDAIFVQAARELASALGDAHPKLVEVARQRAELADPPERAIALLGPVCELMLTRAA
ncbi:MAG TPA: serine/threonine-protein kinase, partial [Nannocystaceae bacterium]|nr:serine/threonine-protein kinase [Nannocystaceae bacterium]